MSKRASYRHGVSWIALNDNSGGDDRLDAESVKGYISTLLLADLFGKPEEDVARDIVKYRQAEDAKEGKSNPESPVRFEGTREDADETFRDDGL